MPNICVNQLRITGNRLDLTEFKQSFLQEGKINPENIVHLEEEDDPVLVYGTKWMDLNSVVQERRDVLEMEVLSAHSPPTFFCLNASLLYPNLEFWISHYEEGRGECGLFHAKNGQVVSQVSEKLKYMTDEREVMIQDHEWVFVDTREPLTSDEEDNVMPVNHLALPEISERNLTLVNSQPCEDGCSICVGGKEDQVAVFCGHVFCRQCITKWFDKGDVCPLCRAPLS